MEGELKDYILKNYNIEYCHIIHYDIDGANCQVIFYTDESKYYKEVVNINIWEMLIFLKR